MPDTSGRDGHLRDARERSRSFSELLLAAVDNFPGMVGFWDRDQICRLANRAYLDWFGLSSDQVLNRSMLELIGPDLMCGTSLTSSERWRESRNASNAP
jgi:PAS domain S-box-containing protein